MLLLILKVALLVFVACGVVAIVSVYVIRGRKMHYRQEVDPYLGSLSQMGVVPPTPLPEWRTGLNRNSRRTPTVVGDEQIEGHERHGCGFLPTRNRPAAGRPDARKPYGLRAIRKRAGG